ncbi:MAG: response regulator [Desulfobacterales bacterium]|nr:response regulator [Desulfobacterales bacterium]
MKVLVVDDEKLSRRVICTGLKKGGFDVLEASDGTQALSMVEDSCIGVLIADWMMPGMDGIELCRRIRSRKEAAYIYILMLTSRSEKEDLLEGFKAGVDGYLSKPPDQDELQALIKAGMRVVGLERCLVEERRKVALYATEMEKLAEERARQLVISDRMASLGTMSAGVAHEINNPTTFISGNVQMIEKFWPYLESLILGAGDDHPDAERLAFIRDEVPGIIAGIINGTERIGRIVSGLKSFAYQGHAEVQMGEVDLHHAMEQALLLCENTLKHNITVERDFCSEPFCISGDVQQLEQVFVNLFTNAAHSMKQVGEGRLQLVTRKKEARGTVVVADTGVGIPKEVLDKIWTPFFTTKPMGVGTGLGLSISLGIIKDHKGEVKAENLASGGARFILKFPLIDPQTASS